MIRLTAVIELEGHGPRALTHESNAKSLIIGRDSKADFQIPLTTISRAHARVAETDNVYVFEDLGSTHGSLINGKKLGKGEKKVLRDGDVIELTKARITCNIQMDKLVAADSGENTKMIADKAVAGILGRLGDAQGEGPFFRVLNGPDEGQKLELGSSRSEWAMGRSKECDFVLNDANVSRRHAIVVKDWHGFAIQDLGSKNGVLVNDKKIGKPKRLKDRDEITVGPIKLVYVDPNADLMAALADVPGFEDESGEYSDITNDPSVMGAPGDESGAGEDEGPAVEDEGPAVEDEGPAVEDEGLADEEAGGEPQEEDEYAGIDPALLATEVRRFPTEWVIVGTVGVIILVCVGLLLLIYAP